MLDLHRLPVQPADNQILFECTLIHEATAKAKELSGAPGRPVALFPPVERFRAPHSAAGKPKKRKSQSAYQRGQRADQVGTVKKLSATIRKPSKPTPTTPRRWRARPGLPGGRGSGEGSGRPATGGESQPADAQCYWARGDYYAKIGDSARAIQDYSTAIGMKLDARRCTPGAEIRNWRWKSRKGGGDSRMIGAASGQRRCR